MLRSHHFIATCFAIIALGTAVGASAGMRPASGNGNVVEITDLQPFTHVAFIPTGSALSSIRIEGIKLVKVATKRRIVTNERYCNQPWAEPGGSMDCQRITEESPVPAYQVTYSYRGRPMVSDEYGNTYFTFSVYFRQDEISPPWKSRWNLRSAPKYWTRSAMPLPANPAKCTEQERKGQCSNRHA